MPQDPIDYDALISEFGGVPLGPGAVASHTARPIDPQTGAPVRIPGDPGYVPFGDEPEPAGPSGGELALEGVIGAASALNPVNVVKGVYNAVRRPVDTVKAIGRGHVDQARQAIDLFRHGAPLNTLAGKADAMEAVGRTMAATTPVIGPAIARVGEEIGSGEPLRMARGAGEAVGMATAGPITRGVTRAVTPIARGAAERLANITMRPGRAVLDMTDTPGVGTTAGDAAARQQLARTALDEGVLPGVVRGSTVAPRRAMDRLLDESASAVEPHRFRQINPDHAAGRSLANVTDRARAQTSPTPDVQTVLDAARDARAHPSLRLSPTAGTMNEITAGNVRTMRGRSGLREDATRAIARDQRREVARVVPEARAPLERVSRLEPVMEAYERAGETPLQVPGLPTIQARILLSAINRAVGPTARGFDKVSKIDPVTSGNLAHSAVLANLLGRDYGQ